MASKPRTADSLADYLADPSSVLPDPADLQQAVERVIALYEQSIERYNQGDGRSIGATFNLYFGNMTGLPLYAVSLYPERTKRRAVPAEILRQFVERNLDLLVDPRNSVGLWYSGSITYLDVSATLPAATPHEQDQVILLAKKYNQVSVFDLARSVEIETGGSGKRISGLPVEAERLPQLQRSVG